MAQTMMAYIANALEMRKQNAAAAQFRAQMQEAQYDRMSNAIASAGKGLGQVFGGGLSKQDRLANSLMQQQYTIPGAQRAQAVNPAMQGPADAIRDQMYMGGMDELNMRFKMEDQTAQRGVQGSQMDARIARLNLAQQASERADQGLLFDADRVRLAQEAAELNRQLKIRQEAEDAYARATDKYKDAKKNATAYNTGIKSHLKQISTAKDQDQWQAGVDALEAEYQAGNASGLKVAKPLVRPFVSEDQKTAVANTEARANAYASDWYPWTDADEERKKAETMPGYTETRPGYTVPPQPEGIFATIPEPPEYRAPSLNTPTQALGGTASGGGGSMPTVPLADALKVDPTAVVGKTMTDKYGNKAKVGP